MWVNSPGQWCLDFFFPGKFGTGIQSYFSFLRFLVLLNLVIFLIIFMLVLLPVLLTKYNITNSTFVLIPSEDTGESKPWFAVRMFLWLCTCLHSFLLWESLYSKLLVPTLGWAWVCCRNKWFRNSQHLITTKGSFSPRYYWAVALFCIIFTLEPKLMEQPLSGPLMVTMSKGKGTNGKHLLKLLPGNDTFHFCCISLPKASHLASPDFSKSFAEIRKALQAKRKI